jgi:hypothetical protein
MALPPALNREFEHVRMNHAERKKLRQLAREAQLSPSNYIRHLLGWPEMSAGRPRLEELDQESDRAWEILAELGERPEDYFPANDDWMDDYR